MRCRKCKKKISEYAKECPYCNTLVKKDETAVNSYIALVENQAKGKENGAKEKERIRIRKSIWFAIISGIFLFFLIAGILRYYRYQWKITEDTVFYEKDNKLIAKNIITNETKEVANLNFDQQAYRGITHLQESFVSYKEKSHELYFVNDIENKLNRDIYSVYKQDTNDWSTNAKCVDQNIVLHTWSEDGSLFYMKVAQDTLYKYNGHKIEQIAIKNIDTITYVAALHCILVTQNNSDVEDEYSFEDSYPTEGKVVGRNKFYLVNVETLDIEDLGVMPEGEYAFTSDYRHLYMLKENQIFDYDLEEKTSSLFMNNVYDFELVTNKGKDRLYYITYTLQKRTLYSCYKDPYSEKDKQVEKSNALKKKESSEEKRLRQNREQFREELRTQTIGEYSGSLYYFEDGKSEKVADGIGGFEATEQSETDKVIVYKTGKIEWTGYVIEKDVYSDAQRSLASLSEMEYEQDSSNQFTYVQLAEYTELGKEPTLYECVKGKATDDYLVEDGQIEKYEEIKEKYYFVPDSYQKKKDAEYQVVVKSDKTGNLYGNVSGKQQACLLTNIIEYYTKEDGHAIVIQEGESSEWTMYRIDVAGNKQVIDENVDGIFADNIWLLNEEIGTLLED
ncbi:MAG: hypothetical protein Q4F05_13795 [bacterium]|nr:hypothetical protein [bacterium]